MEVMEDGNLMDKVRILIQKDMEYYQEKQSVLQENICPAIIGGKLDFPHYASFAAVKLIIWWEDEFVAGFRKPSGLITENSTIQDENVDEDDDTAIVKTSDPDKFISLVTASSEQLLDHLHILTQEALDHADLSVLTGTIGASAVLKNCLWIYIQACSETADISCESLHHCYKQYQEMGEALAERLLDLHNRLISLYILQDAESLDCENSKSFFESERGSFLVQMWWLYTKGTQQDLWNTVPPKMAQMVLSGMLNESLTILTVRYMQMSPSKERSNLFATDISNLLLCVAQLLPHICASSEEMLGCAMNNQNKTLRDLHAKCHELFVTLILRATPLNILYKQLRRGIDSVKAFKSRSPGLSPWIMFALPDTFPTYTKELKRFLDVQSTSAISLEIQTLVAQPQANWALLLKVLGMRNGKVLHAILTMAVKRSTLGFFADDDKLQKPKCAGFLCSNEVSCKLSHSCELYYSGKHYHWLSQSLAFIVLNIGNDQDFMDIFLDVITKEPNWGSCFDRQQIWNLGRPGWYNALISSVHPILEPIIPTVINAVQTGASMYQAMTIVVTCFIQLMDGINEYVPRIAFAIQDVLPVEITPLGGSVLLHILISALYLELVQSANRKCAKVRFSGINLAQIDDMKKQRTLEHTTSYGSFDITSFEEVALAVAEALCSIDEDNKHTEEIEELLTLAKEIVNESAEMGGCQRVEESSTMAEVLVSDLLMTKEGKRSLKISYDFIRNNYEWLLTHMEKGEKCAIIPNKLSSQPESLLHTMFHVGYRSFDQFLSGQWKPQWNSLLQIPLGISIETAWTQIAQRWEFRETNYSSLSSHEASMVSEISFLFKKV